MIILIKTNELTKYYNKNARGILEVSLDIKEGEIFGFIGPNGAGKSTTVRTLLNLIFPTSGKASVMDLDIVSDSVEIRNNVGYIPSEINYYGEMTGEEFLHYAASFYDCDYLAKMKDLSKRLELDLSRKISELSTGNKKKLAIVESLQHSPKILFLDEPTSGLDPLMQNTFFSIIEEEKKQGTTIFYSSHILSEVQRICDRVAIIKEGRIIKVETIEDIMKARAKKVRVKTDKDFIHEDEDIVNIKKENGYVQFVYTGKIEKLLKLLQDKKIEDLTIIEPSLEEVFMHYYQKEDVK
ncbi:MAG: ABC transporter ATP-binding protein [Candidatus Izimaplasma sp.]|nr:ABC transporter ATP-binding protein [Candidatus Izimaplasma bacterium]